MFSTSKGVISYCKLVWRDPPKCKLLEWISSSVLTPSGGGKRHTPGEYVSASRKQSFTDSRVDY